MNVAIVDGEGRFSALWTGAVQLEVDPDDHYLIQGSSVTGTAAP